MIPCAIQQTLMELIFRYEKTALLKQECRKHFKVTLIPSSYSLTSGRCISKRPHLLTQQLNTRSYLFQSSFFFCKNTLFHKWSPHIHTRKAHNKSETPSKISINEYTEKEERNSLEIIYCNFKMSLFKLKSPGFF